MPTTTSLNYSSIDGTLSLSSCATGEKKIIIFSLACCEFLKKFETRETSFPGASSISNIIDI
ncbi:hypothetical protein MKX03_035727 [Papaver bracteatum]|nr:hypothetical protein MKX03_035727 [Papaver bracteatum]